VIAVLPRRPAALPTEATARLTIAEVAAATGTCAHTLCYTSASGSSERSLAPGAGIAARRAREVPRRHREEGSPLPRPGARANGETSLETSAVAQRGGFLSSARTSRDRRARAAYLPRLSVPAGKSTSGISTRDTFDGSALFVVLLLMVRRLSGGDDAEPADGAFSVYTTYRRRSGSVIPRRTSRSGWAASGRSTANPRLPALRAHVEVSAEHGGPASPRASSAPATPSQETGTAQWDARPSRRRASSA
jgi:hypothetical protein